MSVLKVSEWRFVLVNAVFGLGTLVGAILLAVTVWGPAAATETTVASAVSSGGVPGWWLVVMLIIALPILYSVALDWAFGAFRRSWKPQEEYH